MWLAWGNEIDRADRADRANKIGGANKTDGSNRTNKIGGTGTQIGMMGMGRMKKQRSATEGKANLLPPVGLGIIKN